MDDGLEVRVVVVEHVARYAVEKSRVQRVELLGPAKDR